MCLDMRFMHWLIGGELLAELRLSLLGYSSDRIELSRVGRSDHAVSRKKTQQTQLEYNEKLACRRLLSAVSVQSMWPVVKNQAIASYRSSAFALSVSDVAAAASKQCALELSITPANESASTCHRHCRTIAFNPCISSYSCIPNWKHMQWK